MRVLIGCEFSGVVRDAFSRAGHYAVSCDLLPSEKATCLWLKGLPKLIPTSIVEGREHEFFAWVQARKELK